MKTWLARTVVIHRRVVMLAVFLITVVCACLAVRLEVNTDMTKYLADSSPMKQGTTIIADELSDALTQKTIRVMVDDLNDAEAALFADELKAITGVDSLDFTPNSDAYTKDNHTLYVLRASYDYGSEEERAIEAAALSLSDDAHAITVKNDTPANYDLPPSILIVAISLLAVILFVMSHSWWEPILYLVTIGCAVVINMGTSLLQGSIAGVTFSIGAILQLVLSMDYSIILMSRFRQELRSGDATSAAHRNAAMQRAVAGAFTSIASSSLTTFAGLLSLVFMTFKIGADIGIFLAKGVLVSLMCVLVLLPGLILATWNILCKATKPAPTLRFTWLAALEYTLRIPLALGFVGLFVAAYLLQGSTSIAFTLNYNDPIAEVFPTTNQVVLVYANEDEQQAADLAAHIAQEPLVDTVQAWSTTIGKPMTSHELMESITAFGDSGEVEGFSAEMLEQIYTLHATQTTGASQSSKLGLPGLTGASDIKNHTMTIAELVEFIQSDVLDNPLYSRMITDEQRQGFYDLSAMVSDAQAQLVGTEHALMAISIDSATGSSQTAELVERLHVWADEQLTHEHYLVGDAAMVYEMQQGFPTEMLTVTLVSALAIFLVVALAFRSLIVPFILVAVVQCGVYLTVVAIGIQGYSIYYLGMLIVQCILMGATIDYGILYMNNYREARRTLGVHESIEQGYVHTVHTVFTSGLIMIVVTAVLAVTSPEPTIGQICQTISMGATSAVALIMLFLPAISAVLDRWIRGR